MFFDGIEEDRFMGESIHVLTFKESFIRIGRYFTTEDLFSTIHEYSHATSFNINPLHIINNEMFLEIDSLFMELIAADYIENVLKNGDAIMIRTTAHEEYAMVSEALKSQINLIEKAKSLEKSFTCNKELKTIAHNFCHIEPEDLESLLDDYYNSNIEYYLICYIFALELYDLYKTDKDKALYCLKKIILLECKDKLEYYNSIKKLGLIPNLHTREFHKQFSEEVLSLKKQKPE